MDYDRATKLYIELRAENARIEADADALIKANKEKMQKLGVWIQLKAEEDGLDKVNTQHGTVFWTEGVQCSVADANEFFAFVQEGGEWNLLEKRASKTSVRDYVATHGKIPPGINYATTKQINVRSK